MRKKINCVLGIILFFVHVQFSYALNLKIEKNNLNFSTKNCAILKFSDFLDKFSNNVNFQKKFTIFPLKKQVLDLNAEPEPTPILLIITRNKAKFPLMPLKQERQNKLLNLHVNEEVDNYVRVTLSKDDTDYKVHYFFKKTRAGGLTV